ncbi:hypothetical protein D3C79_1007610 [compost metagenome]
MLDLLERCREQLQANGFIDWVKVEVALGIGYLAHGREVGGYRGRCCLAEQPATQVASVLV